MRGGGGLMGWAQGGGAEPTSPYTVQTGNYVVAWARGRDGRANQRSWTALFVGS